MHPFTRTSLAATKYIRMAEPSFRRKQSHVSAAEKSDRAGMSLSAMNIWCRHHLNIYNLNLHTQDLYVHSTRTKASDDRRSTLEARSETLALHRIAT